MHGFSFKNRQQVICYLGRDLCLLDCRLVINDTSCDLSMCSPALRLMASPYLKWALPESWSDWNKVWQSAIAARKEAAPV